MTFFWHLLRSTQFSVMGVNTISFSWTSLLQSWWRSGEKSLRGIQPFSANRLMKCFLKWICFVTTSWMKSICVINCRIFNVRLKVKFWREFQNNNSSIINKKHKQAGISIIQGKISGKYVRPNSDFFFNKVKRNYKILEVFYCLAFNEEQMMHFFYFIFIFKRTFKALICRMHLKWFLFQLDFRLFFLQRKAHFLLLTTTFKTFNFTLYYGKV